MADLQLDALESKGLIRLAALDPELEYLFRHALVQDAAYESLLKQERRALHSQVGSALEQLYPERHGELAAVLARHFEQAGEPDKAIAYLVEAARFASERNAIVEAYELYGRAEALMATPSPEDPLELRRQRAAIQFGRVKAGFSFMDDKEQFAVLEPIAAHVDELRDPRFAANVLLHMTLIRMYHGERPETSPALAATLARVSEIGRELDDPVIGALPRSVIGLFQVFTGELEEGVAALREAAPLLEQKHDFVGSSFALMALGIGLARLGRFEEAEAASERAMVVAEEGDIIARIDARIGSSTIRAIRGDLESAAPMANQCIVMAEDSGATACVVASSLVAGETLLRQGRFADAQDVLEHSSALADLTNESMFRPSINASILVAAASLGNFTTSARSFDESLAEARASHDRWGETNVIWKRAQTEARKTSPDADQMLSDFATATAAFEDMHARPFVARVLAEWGQALRDLGRIEEGDQKLDAALALLDEMGITREAEELRSLLAGSSAR